MSIFKEDKPVFKRKPVWRTHAEYVLDDAFTSAKMGYRSAQVKASEVRERAKKEFKAPKLKRFHRPQTLGGFGWTNTRARRRW